MEREFKWDAFGALQDAVLMWALDRDADSAKMTEMDARYFDTAEGALSAEKTALRLRRENEDSICCLKLRGGEVTENGLHAHAEYECRATCIAEGLSVLPERGAPIELCSRLRTMELAEACRISFSRYTVMLRQDGASAELALDRGRMTVGERSLPLCEIELEYKDGPEEAFLSMGRELMEAFRLRPQPLSKLARARALAELPDRPPEPREPRRPRRPPRPAPVEIEVPDPSALHKPPEGDGVQDQYIPTEVNDIFENSEPSEAAEAPEVPETPEITEQSEPVEEPETIEPSEAPEPPEAVEEPEAAEPSEVPEAPEPSEAPEAVEPSEAPEQTEPVEASEPTEPTEAPEPFEEFALQELTDMLKQGGEPSEVPEPSEAHEPSEVPEQAAPLKGAGASSEPPEQLDLFDVIELPDLSELRRSLDMPEPSGAPDSEPPPDLPKLLDMLKILEKKE